MSQPAETDVYNPHTRYAEAKAREDAVVLKCRTLWRAVADEDEATQEAARQLIEEALELVEDEVDLAAIDVAEADPEPPIPWETVKAELGW